MYPVADVIYKKKYKSKILKGLPYNNISPTFVSKLSNKDLNSLHYRSHSFYTWSCKVSRFAKYIPIIKKKHDMFVKEFLKRGLHHNSELPSCDKVLAKKYWKKIKIEEPKND